MQQILKSITIALQNIKANPLYTFLSTLGIIIGVASLVAILALGDGLEQTGREQIESTTSIQMLGISPKKFDVVNDVRVPREHVHNFSVQDARDLEKQIQRWGITELIATSSRVVSYRDSSIGVYIQATMEHAPDLQDVSISGSFFTQNDVDQKAKKAVLTEALAISWNANKNELIGDSVLIEGQFYEIIGMIEEGTQGMQIIIPTSTYLEHFKNPNDPSFVLKSRNVEDVPLIKNEVENWLDDKYEGGREAFTISTYEGRVKQLSQGILIFKLVMGAITGISVLVGGIGIMNVLLISVKERTREIGIRKATGAQKKDIVLQFLSESVTISVVGSIIGWGVGIAGVFGLVEIINRLTDLSFNAALQPGTIILVLVIAVLVGMIFGTYPAWKAANLTPVDAIRHE